MTRPTGANCPNMRGILIILEGLIPVFPNRDILNGKLETKYCSLSKQSAILEIVQKNIFKYGTLFALICVGVLYTQKKA